MLPDNKMKATNTINNTELGLLALIHLPKKQPLEVFYKKMVLKILHISHANNCARVTFPNTVAGLRPEAYYFIKKVTLAQVLSCEFC